MRNNKLEFSKTKRKMISLQVYYKERAADLFCISRLHKHHVDTPGINIVSLSVKSFYTTPVFHQLRFSSPIKLPSRVILILTQSISVTLVNNKVFLIKYKL